MYRLSLNLVAIVFLLIFSLPALADSRDTSVDERLNELNREIEFQNNKLEDVYLVQEKLKTDLSHLNKEMNGLRLEEARLKLELDRLFQEWERTNERIAELENKIGGLKEQSLDRLRALYMAQNNNGTGYLTNVSAVEQLPTVAYLLSKIERYDRGIVAELSDLFEELKVEEEKYERTINQQKILKKQIVVKANQLQDRINKKEAVVRLLKKKQAETEGLLTKLRAHALRLETVVTSITEGADERSRTSDEEQVADQQVAPVEEKEFNGAGLKKARGTLTKPVNGKVVRRFGKFRHAEFKDFVFNKGILFESSSNTSVVAISAGKVIYVGRLPGYGNMVILDHGKRAYSLYARLDDIFVSRGQIVDENSEIGEVSPQAAEGNFYFEIRINGKPVNPDLYYGKL